MSSNKLTKAEREVKYRKNKDEFKELTKKLVEDRKHLTALRSLLERGGKGATVRLFTKPETILDIKGLARLEADFDKRIKELDEYFAVSIKREKTSTRPENLTGVYGPVVAGPALIEFFNSQGRRAFGYRDPIKGQSSGWLMDALPKILEGYVTRTTITTLFWIHAYVNGSVNKNDGSRSTGGADFTNAFDNKKFPAVFYYVPGKTVTNKDGKTSQKWDKILMSEAISRGLIRAPMTTFEILLATVGATHFDSVGEDIAFKADNFKAFNFNRIAGLNYYSGKMLSEVPDQAAELEKESTRREIVAEHAIVKETSDKWKTLRNPPKQKKM